MTPGTRANLHTNGKDNLNSPNAFQEGAHSGKNGSGQAAGVSQVQQVLLSGPYLSARDQVMIEFQRASLEMARRFLETQQNVMLAYLNRAQQSGNVAAMQFEMPPTNGIYPPVSTLSEIRPLLVQEPQANYYPPQAHSEKVAELSAISVELPRQPIQTVQALSSVTQGTGLLTEGPNSVAQGANSVTQGTSSIAQAASLAAQTINSSAQLNPEKLIASLIDIVSERTGYPPEMLDPSLDLEADLGIDSIKRVEILNSFRKLLPEETQSLLEDGIEKLASVKTLAGIMDWIKTDLNPAKLAAAAESTGIEAERELV